MTEDCFDCLRVDMNGNQIKGKGKSSVVDRAIKSANAKGGKAVLILDEVNAIDPNFKESTESQANRIIAGRKITKQNKRRDN